MIHIISFQYRPRIRLILRKMHQNIRLTSIECQKGGKYNASKINNKIILCASNVVKPKLFLTYFTIVNKILV